MHNFSLFKTAYIHTAQMILDIIFSLLAIILVWSILKYFKHVWSLSKYPNGPFPLPLIGNFHLFNGAEPPYVTFVKLCKTYGDVFSVSMGKLTTDFREKKYSLNFILR